MLPGECKEEIVTSRELFSLRTDCKCRRSCWILLSLRQCPINGFQLTKSCLVYGQQFQGEWAHPVWKATTLKKIKTDQHGLNCVLFPAVMEDLNSSKSPYVWLFTDSWAVANGLALWSGRRARETWPIKGMSVQGTALWECEGCFKLEHVDAHQKNSQVWKVTGIHNHIYLGAPLREPPRSMK